MPGIDTCLQRVRNVAKKQINEDVFNALWPSIRDYARSLDAKDAVSSITEMRGKTVDSLKSIYDQLGFKESNPEATVKTKEEEGKQQEQKFSDRARDVAERIRTEGFASVLPDWAKADLPEGTQKAGFSSQGLNEAIAKAIETFADAYDKGVELAQALGDGFQHIKDYFTENTNSFDEDKIRGQYERNVKQLFNIKEEQPVQQTEQQQTENQSQPEPQPQEVKYSKVDVERKAKDIKSGKADYNDVVQGQSEEFIEALLKELTGSKRFSVNEDGFRKDVRRQKDLGLTKQQIEEGLSTRKRITKTEQRIIDEEFLKDYENDKAVAELREALKNIKEGTRPRSVLKRLSVSSVTDLVRAMSELSYTTVSNKQLEDIADYILDVMDLDKAQQYLNAMSSNNLADVKQLLRAKMIIRLQKSNKATAVRLAEEMAEEATTVGRQTQSLKRSYEILGAQGGPVIKTAFAKKYIQAVNNKAKEKTEHLVRVISKKQEDVDRLEEQIKNMNKKIHEQAQSSSLFGKIRDIIDKLCGTRNK